MKVVFIVNGKNKRAVRVLPELERNYRQTNSGSVEFLKNLANLKKGVRIDHPEVTYHKAKEVLLKSNVPCPIEADGEYVGLAPATLSVLPEAIVFLMPSQMS